MKRALDVLASIAGILVLLPVLLVLAVIVAVDTPGPVLYRQVRVGRHGACFDILKFRTMTVGADSGLLLTVGADERVTRSGRWLRRSKLDELPQLANVLLGQMSLVGPRPEVPRYVALWSSEARSRILSVRPGITDPVSCELVDESVLLGAAADADEYYVSTLLPRKEAAYVEYVDRRSFRGDLAIILGTCLRIARQ